MGILERKEREKEHRKEEIVDAAEKIFFEKGLQAATMDEIAEKAELSKGTLYLYYKSKEDLYLAVLMRGFEVLHGMFETDSQEESDVVRTLIRYQQTYFEFFQKHRKYFRMLHFLQSPHFHKQVSPEMMQECSLENQKIWRLATGLIERGIKEKVIIPELKAIEVLIILWSSATQLMIRIDNESDRWKETMNVDLERVLRISNSLLLGSILTPEAKRENQELLNSIS